MNLSRFGLGIFLCFCISGCQPTVNTSGNICDADDLKVLKIGEHGINDVYRILGTPSFALAGNRVMYLGRKLKSTAFFKPKVTDEQAVLITFDGKGTLRKWDIVKLDPKNVHFDPNITPAKETDRSTMDHILDNFSRKARKM